MFKTKEDKLIKMWNQSILMIVAFCGNSDNKKISFLLQGVAGKSSKK